MGGRVDEIADVMRARRIPEDELLKQLRAFGLGEYEIELLMLRYVEGKSMKEIVKEQGWQNVNSANYFMRKALKLLKQAGFVFK